MSDELSWYSDEALRKQAALVEMRARGETPPLTAICGLYESRTQPTEDERCRCCRADAREGAGGDGRYCGLCISRGHDEDEERSDG